VSLVEQTCTFIDDASSILEKTIGSSNADNILAAPQELFAIREDALVIRRQVQRMAAYLSMYLVRIDGGTGGAAPNTSKERLFASPESKERAVSQMPKIPAVAEQLQDGARDTILTYTDETHPEASTIDERAALTQLDDFLDNYIQNGSDERLLNEAESLRGSLNFMGEKELSSASAATAKDWQEYLDGDENRQILVIAGASDAAPETAKSDAYVFERILEHMDADEKTLEKYQGRLITDRDQLTGNADAARVVILDDWSISGEQLGKSYAAFVAEDPSSPYKQQLEVNLLVADPEMIKDGFFPRQYDESVKPDQILPVQAHFAAKPRLKPVTPGDHVIAMHISGTHSVTDFGFSNTIESMANELRGPDGDKPVETPAVINLAKTYSKETLVHTKKLRDLNKNS
jgi:hypothetical protein